jgi:hypothetical protein
MVMYYKNFNVEAEEDNEEIKAEEKPSNKKDFKIMSELHNTTRHSQTNEQTTFEDILFNFLDKVFDISESELEKNLPDFIREMSKSKTIGKAGITSAISRFS